MTIASVLGSTLMGFAVFGVSVPLLNNGRVDSGEAGGVAGGVAGGTLCLVAMARGFMSGVGL